MNTSFLSVMSGLKGQKQPSRVVLKKRFSENMQQIYRGTLMSKCDFSNVGGLLLKGVVVQLKELKLIN